MVIMACDHPIHMNCLMQHAFVYMDRQNLTFSAEELDAMPMDEFMGVFKKRWTFYALRRSMPRLPHAVSDAAYVCV